VDAGGRAGAILPVKITSVKRSDTNRFLKMFRIGYRDRDNRRRTWELVSRRATPVCASEKPLRPDAVVMVPRHSERGCVVIVREFRVGIGGWQYGFPAGLVENDEPVESACARELKEETGLTLNRIRHISPPLFTSTGISDESVAMVYLDCSGEASSRYNTRSEQIETLLVTAAEARKLVARNDIYMDVKTWLVLSVYADGSPLF
jgi:ADP-ribose pyrophosphatase